MQVLLGEAHASDVDRDEATGFRRPVDELGGAATNVEHKVRRGLSEAGGRAGELESRFLFARDELRAHAQRHLCRTEEVLAIVRVARCTRRGRADALDVEFVDDASVLLQYRQRARDGIWMQLPGAVDALAETRDARAAIELHQLPVALISTQLGDEQTRGVGADVDGRDARHGARSCAAASSSSRRATHRPSGSSPPARYHA